MTPEDFNYETSVLSDNWKEFFYFCGFISAGVTLSILLFSTGVGAILAGLTFGSFAYLGSYILDNEAEKNGASPKTRVFTRALYSGLFGLVFGSYFHGLGSLIGAGIGFLSPVIFEATLAGISFLKEKWDARKYTNKFTYQGLNQPRSSIHGYSNQSTDFLAQQPHYPSPLASNACLKQAELSSTLSAIPR